MGQDQLTDMGPVHPRPWPAKITQLYATLLTLTAKKHLTTSLGIYPPFIASQLPDTGCKSDVLTPEYLSIS